MAAAGTLEIQLIADVARLQNDMRAMQSAVDAATGNMSNGFDRTGKSARAANDNIGNLAIEADRLRSKIDPMYAAQKRFNDEMDAADALLKRGMISTREHGAAVDMARKALNDHAVSVAGNTKELSAFNPKVMEAGETSKLSRHHVMNLGYQFQDIFVSLASGQKPMTVFIQQGAQIGSVMADAGVGVGGMVKQIGGLMVDFLKAHPIILGLTVAVGAAYAAFELFQSSVKESGELKEYANSLGLTAEEMKKLGPVGITAMDVIKGIWKTVNEALGLSEVFNTVGKWFSELFSKAWEWAKEASLNIYGALAASFDSAVYIWKNFPRILGDVVISGANLAIGGIEKLINFSIQAINYMAESANAVLKILKMPTIPEMDEVQLGRIANSYAGAATSVADIYSASFAKRTKQAAETLKEVGGAFSDNIIAEAKERLDKSAKDIISKRAQDDTKEAAGKAGKDAGEAFGKMFAEAVQSVQMQMGPYKPLIANDNIDEILSKQAAERNKVYKEQQKAIQDNIDYATNAAQDIGNLIGGTFGKGVADLGTVLSKNFPDLMASLGGSMKGIVESIDAVLGKLGTSLKEIGAYGGVGGAMSSIVGGSSVGGSVGGAVGGVIGGGIKALGKFGGPLGAIAGGILGSIIGGLFKKTKQASATISVEAGKLDVAGIVGNNADFKRTAGTLADSVIGGISKAASLLGAEIEGALKLSIGQRDKKFVVDSLGLGRTKGSGTISFGTQEEAVAYAIDSAIRNGVLGGIRSGTQALLKGMGDLEDRLQKAIDFEGVFRALKDQADPFTTAMEKLDTRFKGLILTFQEAGATSQEWADLERYYQIEREKAIKEGNAKALEAVSAARDQLTEAYNRESEAILTTLERFKNLTADLESFRASLAEQLMTAQEIYTAAKARFDEVAKLAVQGNEKAISDLVSVSQKYLDAAKNFLTPEEYNREISNVMKAVDLAIAQTKTMEDYAQLQLDALNNSVDGLLTVNDSVLSVRDAIKALADAQAQVKTAQATTLVFASKNAGPVDWGAMTPEEQAAYLYSLGFSIPGFADGGMHSGGLRIVGENGPELEATGASRIYNADQTASILSGGAVAEEVAALRSEMKAALYQIAKNTGKTTDQLNRWDGDGMPEVRVLA